MKTYSKLGLEKILKLCKENHVLTIADEVMTGFGRTGPLFVSQQLSTKPNIICLAKGLSGGTLPLAATICDQEIVHAFFGLKQQHFFFHGHTYTANPIACSAAIASLDLLEDIQCNVKRNEITKKHTEFKKKIESCQGVSRIEAFGTILAIECQIKKNHDYFDPIRKKLYRFFLDQHILMRPLGNVIYFIPPYSIQEHELEKIYFTTQLFLENPC